MTLKSKLLAGTLTAGLVVALAALAAWYFVFDSDSPPPVSLAEAAESAGMPSGTGDAAASPIGEWQVVPGDATFAGYRVDQQVAGIGTETVVGRTSGVEGALTFDGAAITDAEITVDMNGLESDESLRDNVLRGEAIETGDFPTAGFALTSPITVTELPAEDQAVTQTVAGELTLHGVTRPIEMEVEAVLQEGRLIVVGSEEVQFADFGITPPRGPASVLSVEDHGIIEVQLVFEKAA